MIIKTKDIKEFCNKNDIEYLGIFGSHARGDAKESSDVDVLIRFKKRKSLLEFIRMERALSKIMRKKVDMVTENGVSKYLRDIIKREVKTIYEG